MTGNTGIIEKPDDITYFQQAGKQTQVDESIQQLAAGIMGTTEEKIQKILSLVQSLQSKRFDDKVFRKRTGSQIIAEGYVTGCTDSALVFISIARASGLSTKYLETIDEKWLREGGGSIGGHIYAEVYDDHNKQWILVDPMGAKADILFPNNRVLFKTGLDSWDIGITDFNSLQTQFESFRKTWTPKQAP